MTYLAFERGGDSLIARVIRWRTNGAFSHVEAVKDLDCGLCFSAKLGEDVRWKYIHNLKDARFWELVAVPSLDEEAVWREANRIAAMRPQYDLRGILRFAAGLRNDDWSRWFCSELVLWLLMAGGAFRWIDDPGVSPAALHMMARARAEAMHALV